MKALTRLPFLVLAVGLVAILSPETSIAKSESAAMEAARSLRAWQFEDARKQITAITLQDADAEVSRYLQAELDFLDGKYDAVVATLQGLPASAVQGNVGSLRKLAKSSYSVVRDFQKSQSSGGHFEIWHAKGKDETIVELVSDVLEASYSALEKDLGHAPTAPIRVEILGSAKDLAQLSTLSAKEIETTGTIALCKYGKLMVVSPRATHFGYPWMDTLTHEYVHYVVTQVSRDRVPVWLHEGLARYLQGRWRGPAQSNLSRLDETLLAQALKKRSLIPFDDMHPSMAKLPSQEAAALAFAEVNTLVAFVHKELGTAGLATIIKTVGAGTEARKAVSKVMSRPWQEVEKDWKEYLKSLSLKGRPHARQGKQIRFRKGTKDDDNLNLENLTNLKAQKHARLAGMLRARGKLAASAIEYEKAMQSEGGDNPQIASKLSRVYLSLGRNDEAIGLAMPVLETDPMDPLAPSTLGAAYLAKGLPKQATEALELVLRINPFDTSARCGLAQGYEELQDKRAARERRACTLLRQER